MKWLHLGLATAGFVLTLSTSATAQPAPQYAVSRQGDKARLTMRSGEFRFEQVLSPTAFAFTIESGRDRVQIVGDHRGELRVLRGDVTRALNMAIASDEQLRELRAWLDDSIALRELGRVASEERQAKSRYAAFVENAHALVRTLQGDLRATGDLIVQRMARRSAGFQTVAQSRRADECWDGYSRSVLRYTYELEACVNEARSRFNPIITAWCGYEYNIKATLAGYWLLDCNGIP
jgi:hypothetical protein